MNNISVGLLGVGAMGKALADKMIENQVKLNIWNRNKEKIKEYNEKETLVCSSPKELVKNSDVIILMLSDYTAIKEVIENVTQLNNKTIIQMGTIAPSESINISNIVKDKGGVYFEAPVLGSIPDIKSGKLIIMIGGEEENLSTWKWLFNIFGPKPLFIGQVGHAATLKLAMNQLIGSLTCAFSASLGLILKKNIDVNIFMEIVRDSALYAPTFDKKLSKMLTNDFGNGNFSTKHLLKDLNLFINEAKLCNINISSVESVRNITEATVNNGKQDDDYSALYSEVNK